MSNAPDEPTIDGNYVDDHCEICGQFEAECECKEASPAGWDRTEPEQRTETMSIEQFVKRHGITLDFVPAPKNPNFFDAMEGSAHWLCALKAGERKLETYYTKGPGLRIWATAKPGTAYLGPERLPKPKGWKIGERASRPWNPTLFDRKAFEAWTAPEPPTVEELLDCLASDASGIESSRSFEDWAGDFGYDTDSRRAERAYEVCKATARDLETLLGRTDYRFLLESVERL